ncbi:hypothetical protein CCH79_00018443, partial [Gambusia affinis]
MMRRCPTGVLEIGTPHQGKQSLALSGGWMVTGKATQRQSMFSLASGIQQPADLRHLDLLIWGGQLRGVACEKAIKVLCITPTLPWRGEMKEWIEFHEGKELKQVKTFELPIISAGAPVMRHKEERTALLQHVGGAGVMSIAAKGLAFDWTIVTMDMLSSKPSHRALAVCLGLLSWWKANLHLGHSLNRREGITSCLVSEFQFYNTPSQTNQPNPLKNLFPLSSVVALHQEHLKETTQKPLKKTLNTTSFRVPPQSLVVVMPRRSTSDPLCFGIKRSQKFKIHKTVANPPGHDRRRNIDDKAKRRIIQTVKKEPRKSSKDIKGELQAQGTSVLDNETETELFGKKHQLYVHRWKNEAYQDKNIVLTVGGGSMFHVGKGCLESVQSIMTSQDYQGIVERNVLPSIRNRCISHSSEMPKESDPMKSFRLVKSQSHTSTDRLYQKNTGNLREYGQNYRGGISGG